MIQFYPHFFTEDAVDHASCDAVAVGERREAEHLAQRGAIGLSPVGATGFRGTPILGNPHVW